MEAIALTGPVPALQISPRLRRRIAAIALGTIGISLILWALCFLHGRDGRTLFGPALGGDFPAFYAAGTVLNGSEPSRLYDRALGQEIYHRLIPGESADSSLPFAYPPALAVIFQPLARLPYSQAYAAWSIISLALYAGALAFLWDMTKPMQRQDRIMAILLAASFEPFLIESLAGGQLAAMAIFFACLALWLHERGWDLPAGFAWGLLAYKPTLLVVILPVMILARQWRLLAGAAAAIVVLAGISLISVGPAGCVACAQLMLSYGHSADGQGMVLRTWKFIDLNAFLRLFLGDASLVRAWIIVPVYLAGISLLAMIWQERLRAWPAILAATLVLNIYVGIYDAVLIVPAAWLAAREVSRISPGRFPPMLALGIAAIWVLPWVSQTLAQHAHLQVLTLAIAGFGAYCGYLAIKNGRNDGQDELLARQPQPM